MFSTRSSTPLGNPPTRGYSPLVDHDGARIQPTDSAGRSPSPADATTPPRSQVIAWAFWDWGQQAFQTVILTFVFSVYITSAVAPNDEIGSTRLGSAQTIAGIAIALLCPVMGVLADRVGRRRQMLGISTAALAIAITAMFWVQPDPSYLTLAVWLMAVASVVSEIATVFYYGMLLQVSTPATYGRVSGMGWGLGYLGGLVALVACLFLFVLGKDADSIRYVALFCAAWTVIFCGPVILIGPNTPKPEGGEPFSFFGAYRDIARRIGDLWHHQRSLLHFFVASAIFRDGLGAVFAFAGVIAAGSFGFSSEEVIYLGIAANLVAGVATWVMGGVDDRLGPRRLIVGGLSIMILACLAVFLVDGSVAFWTCAIIISICVGPLQSASRSMLARFTEPGVENENFGLYATSGRAVSFLSPFAFTVAISLGGDQKAGILGIVVVLLIGLLAFLPLRPQYRTTAIPASSDRPA